MNLRFRLHVGLLVLFLFFLSTLPAQVNVSSDMARKAREMGASQAQINAAMNNTDPQSLPRRDTLKPDNATRRSMDSTRLSTPDATQVRQMELRRQIEQLQLQQRRDTNMVFGREIFTNKNLTFAPSYNIATPPNYILGPGDEVVIEVWGDAESHSRHKISPEGSISIQGVGPVDLAGLTVSQAQNRIQGKIGQIMSGQVRVSLGDIRSIKVNLSGEVVVPGTYTLPSLATLFNAIYLAGGVNDIGSLRNIRVYRNSKLVGELDVYDYLINGRYETNVRLEDNDMIIVPPYDNLVKVSGKVKRERIYEMKKGETLGKLVEFAGGFTGDAYTDNLSVRRKSGRKLSMMTVGNGDFESFPMSDGDQVQVGEVLPVYSNLVTIDGAVWRPGAYELSEKTATLSQLIAMAEGLRGSEFASRGQISRLDTITNIYRVIPFVVSEIAAGRNDMALANRDVVYIPNIYDLHEEYTVNVGGEVNFPNKLAFRDGMTVEDVIVLCGGLRESASLAKIEVARRIKNPDATGYSPQTAEIHSINIPADLAIAPEDKRFILQPFDEIFVRRSPGYSEQKKVQIEGEVLFGGQYVLSSAGERLSDLVRKTGGFSPEAYTHGASVQRKLSDDEKAKIAAAMSVAENNKGRDSLSVKSVQIPDYYPIGIDVVKAVENPGSSDDIILMDGDRILVPKYNGTVRISGAVLYENSVVFDSKRLKDYIYQAGGYKSDARRRPYVVYMNGKVASTRSIFFGKRYPKVEPGCQVIVPMKPQRKGNGLANVMGMMSSTASLAAMAASIVNLTR